ncbi:substrate-binding domain-containing protein [Undibacterium sp. 5I1]|nr:MULTISPECIES: substrate-binding domain-containing protein [unclassified Undibacterium]MDY7539458.1 substrate-binding domain-containing protein [Undibacterium sp. 5I1]MEB0230717.1 substrate-binding domain-containing protein [Undibacterium sp. 10I3]
MTAIQSKCLTLLLVAFCSISMIGAANAQENPMLFLSRANAVVAKAAGLTKSWEVPAEGPKLQKKKKIVFIAADLSDPGIVGVFNGIKEAVKGADWELLYIDCRGRCNQGAAIVSQALDMAPNGIILAGVDATSQAKGLAAAAKAKVPVVGWHSMVKSGPSEGLFTNITSNPKEAAQIAALYGVVESNSKAGIVVFSDMSSPYTAAKSNAIVEVIKQCENCRLLSVEDVPVAEAYTKMSKVVENLEKKFGTKWTHAIGVNDVYFDLMEKPTISALMGTNKVIGLSAGDGSYSAFKRIRGNLLQIGTVPEPLFMHGWQLVDEMNRAFSGVAPSGYVTPVHLVTNQNIAYDGGPKNMFDPDNDYRNQYLKIWAK